MPNTRILTIAMLFSFASATSAEAKDYSSVDSESVNCYQNGQLIFETTDRLRAFQPASAMTLLADISTGQVQESTRKLYASDRAGLVCVVKDTE